MPLIQPGIKARAGTLHFQAYFTPDLPSEVKVAARKTGVALLDEKFVQRERQWRALVPRRLANKGRYMVSATDEQARVPYLSSHPLATM